MDNNKRSQTNIEKKNNFPVMWIGIGVVVVLIVAAFVLISTGPAKYVPPGPTTITTTIAISSTAKVNNTTATTAITLVGNSIKTPALINASAFDSVLGGSWKITALKNESLGTQKSVSIYYENLTSTSNSIIALGIVKFQNSTTAQGYLNLISLYTNKTYLINGTIGSSRYIYLKMYSNAIKNNVTTSTFVGTQIDANYSAYIVSMIYMNHTFNQTQGVALISAELAKFS